MKKIKIAFFSTSRAEFGNMVNLIKNSTKIQTLKFSRFWVEPILSRPMEKQSQRPKKMIFQLNRVFLFLNRVYQVNQV